MVKKSRVLISIVLNNSHSNVLLKKYLFNQIRDVMGYLIDSHLIYARDFFFKYLKPNIISTGKKSKELGLIMQTLKNRNVVVRNWYPMGLDEKAGV